MCARLAGDSSRVALPHPEIIFTLRQGDEVLLDDGRLRLTVLRPAPAPTAAGAAARVACRVDVGGELSDRKGVNTPTVSLPIPALTAKDREDLAAALAMGADWVALSFVQRASDVAELRDLVRGQAGVMAKLEKPAAVVGALEEVVAASDACMVARGDLGVEMAPEEVPVRAPVRASPRQSAPVRYFFCQSATVRVEALGRDDRKGGPRPRAR